ncbi:flagellar basal-body MS-ring/collar protein FliF [uncultured Erythrobacter sp.]|uniref:flagellar basal-body MS-ring/collar protein FliF n=1 Tax=uncultured Erythrobacter sp. TaxID=263913 RepID=UPI0026238907|nr:flagellar basal-body MS-ring/collar protein FliF [uncultured Erythrobacter sp.]
MLAEPRQLRLFILLFLGIIALFAALWFFVLRTDYVPIYENIRESDASQIVAELDTAGIAYQLANDGHDILVPEDEAANARVAVAGANISMGGTTGFELFNENELGLTEFAQKINLQRAIQGELSRTIMMMSGVEFARVHLAMPERTLFRSEQDNPTAAVTVEMEPTQQLSSDRVDGIRQLVASSVPGLLLADVVVLNEAGGLMGVPNTGELNSGSPASSEREAVEQLVAIRARGAIADVLPQQPFDLQVSAFDQVANETAAVVDEEGQETTNSQTDSRRIFGLEDRSLRIMVRTPQELSPEERSIISDTLTDAIALSGASGDMLDFTTGALAAADQPPPRTVTEQAPPSPQGDWTANSDPLTNIAGLSWLWLAIPLGIVVLALFAARPRRKLSDEEADSFAELLRSANLEREAS